MRVAMAMEGAGTASGEPSTDVRIARCGMLAEVEADADASLVALAMDETCGTADELAASTSDSPTDGLSEDAQSPTLQV